MGSEGGGVLVLGATSLVGCSLLPLLREAGVAAIAFSRRPANDVEGVRWVGGDLARPETLATVGVAHEVFSFSPIWLLPDVLPTLSGLGVRRLVAFSSTSVLTKANSTSAAERATAARLAEGEARTLAWAQANGVGCVILRPTLIYAEGQDANVSRIAGLIRRVGVIPLAGNGAGLRQPVHAADLAIGALAAMQSETASGVYVVPGGETLTYRAMVERVFAGMGRRPAILQIPAPLFGLALGLARPLLPGTTREMGSRIGEDLVFDPEPARRDFAWSPRAFRPDFTRA